MKSIKIYRIENQTTMNGMWYDHGGNYYPFINTLTEGISRNLPMPWDARYGVDGLRWYSAGKSKQNMNQWFSPLDALELTHAGFSLYEFVVDQYMVEEHQVLFPREAVIEQKVILISELWEDLPQLSNAPQGSRSPNSLQVC